MTLINSTLMSSKDKWDDESNVKKFIYITTKESMKQINKDKVKSKYKGFFFYIQW